MKWLQKVGGRTGIALILIFLVIFTVLPFYWMAITSVKPNAELFSTSSPLWVKAPTLMHYQNLIKRTEFENWFLNSVVVSGATTLIALTLGALGAYGVARLRFRGAGTIARLTLIGYLVPRSVLFIPLYQVLNTIGLIDTRTGLGLTYLTFSLPFTMWLLIGYFKAIPRDLDEAALIDGCTPLSALWRVILPLVRPGLVASAIFSFSMAWNEYMYPLAFMQTGARKPLTVGISALQLGDVFIWGQIMAAGTLASIPIVIFYAAIHRHIVGGLAAGGVKG